MSVVEPNLERWRGRVALVTGASSGIGAAIAEALGAAGLRIVLAGRDRRRLQRVARRAGGEPLIVCCDQARLSENRRLFQRIREQRGGVDVLVQCAAVRGGVSLLDAPWPEVQGALDLNVGATLWCARAALAQMARKREGAIINLGSMVGHRVPSGVPAMYAATKHALRVLTDGLRSEVAARGLPIKIALISPGLTDTPWHRQRDGLRRGRRKYPHAPLAPADIAGTVRYILATPPTMQIRDILLSSAAQPY